MKFFLFLSLLVAASLPAHADPDCVLRYRFTNHPNEVVDGYSVIAAPGTSMPFNNINEGINTGCNSWIMSYSSEGFTAITVALQSAPNTATPAQPYGQHTPSTAGTFVTFVGTTVSGSNPSSALASGMYAVQGYQPWIRVNLSTATGTGSVNVSLLGWKSLTMVEFKKFAPEFYVGFYGGPYWPGYYGPYWASYWGPWGYGPFPYFGFSFYGGRGGVWARPPVVVRPPVAVGPRPRGFGFAGHRRG